MVDQLFPTDPGSVGRYKLLGRLGAGGMGVVYLAQAPDGAQYAVKVLSGSHRLAPELRQRLAREARSLTVLDSPNVVRIIEVDTDAEVPYLVMTYAGGEGLDRAVPDGGLDTAHVERYGAQLAGALAEVHAHGIIHRDLKPNNVILGPDGVTLVDFGIASLDDEGTTALTREGTFLGSLAWLAPEVIQGGAADERSDVFGLGLILGYLALGRHPYGTGRPEAVMYRIMHEQPDLASADARLRDIVSAVLQRDPAARPTAAAVEAAVRSADNTPLPRAKPRAPKRRWTWALAAVSAAAIAGSFTLASGGEAAETAQTTGNSAPTTENQPTAVISSSPAEALADPTSFDFTSTCTWSQRDFVNDQMTGMFGAFYSADCGEGGQLEAKATRVDASEGYPYGAYVITGELDGKSIYLETDFPSSDNPDPSTVTRWQGTYGGVPVALWVDSDGNGFFVDDGSRIGNGAIRATGPQADINDEAMDPWDYLIWDNPSTVTGRYFGDDAVTQAQAAALCNLVTVGVPASTIFALDG